MDINFAAISLAAMFVHETSRRLSYRPILARRLDKWLLPGEWKQGNRCGQDYYSMRSTGDMQRCGRERIVYIRKLTSQILGPLPKVTCRSPRRDWPGLVLSPLSTVLPCFPSPSSSLRGVKPNWALQGVGDSSPKTLRISGLIETWSCRYEEKRTDLARSEYISILNSMLDHTSCQPSPGTLHIRQGWPSFPTLRSKYHVPALVWGMAALLGAIHKLLESFVSCISRTILHCRLTLPLSLSIAWF